jgi:predicted permease
MFNPWPQTRDARQLRFVSAVVNGGSGYSQHYNQFEYLRQNTRSFSDLTANELAPVDLAGSGATPERYWGGVVASNYFQFLGVQPVLGRGFTPHDDRAYGSAPEVVIGYDLWHSRFHGDASILGKTIQVDRHSLTIVGIAPRGFVGIYGGLAQSLWVPLSELADLTGRPDPLVAGNFGLQIAVRLRPGVSDAQAGAELHTLAQQFAKEQNSTYYNRWDLVLNDSAHMSRGIYDNIGEQMPFQAGAAALLLILICANVAGLLIQRSTRRAREVAIRTALGATRRQLIRQLLIETTLLTVAGGVAGWLFSLALSRSLYALLPKFGVSFAFNLGTDWRILLFAVGMMVVVVIACGLLPARQVLRMSQAETLHSGSISVLGSRGGFAKRALVSVQLGICFVLLIACGLLVRTLWNVVNRDPGFDTRNTLVAYVDLTRAGYTQEKGLAFQRALLEKLQSSPEIKSASITSYVPMGASGGGNVREVAVEGYEPAKNESMSVVTDSEGPEFFHAMRIPVMQGREFTGQDVAGAPCVAMVNDGMAKKYWPKGNALGGRVTVSKKDCTVVGIVHNYVYRNVVGESGDPVLYLPILQDCQGWFGIVMRSRTSAYNVLPTLQAAVNSLDSTLPITDVDSLNDHIQVSYSGQKVPAQMIAVYGLCCLLVALLGVYATMAYSVSERNREFALRMALGAERSQVLGLVMRSGLQIVLGGLVIGTLGTFFAVRVLKSMLFGVSTFDPASTGFALLLIVLTACAAALVPARRAASTEPMTALRTE